MVVLLLSTLLSNYHCELFHGKALVPPVWGSKTPFSSATCNFWDFQEKTPKIGTVHVLMNPTGLEPSTNHLMITSAASIPLSDDVLDTSSFVFGRLPLMELKAL